MEKLKNTINNYSHWAGLEKSCTEIETFLGTSFPIAVESCKALVETICKTILTEQKVSYSGSVKVQQLMSETVKLLGFPNYSEQLKHFGRSLVTITQNLAEIRNDIALVSHGTVVDELHHEKIDQISASLLVNTIETLACFLIEYYELEFPKRMGKAETKVPELKDFEEFNLYFDDLYGAVKIAEYQYQPSEVLFFVDPTAYQSEYQKYLENENDTD